MRLKMGISTLTTTLCTPSHSPSIYLSYSDTSNYRFNSSCFYHNHAKSSQWRFNRKCSSISASNSTLKDCGDGGAISKSEADIWADYKCVEVIGIGNRVDSVLDFCLRSPSNSQSLRFWNIIRSESLRGQLQQKLVGNDHCPNIVEAPINEGCCSKAVVLVTSAGYGDDSMKAANILRTIRSGSGLAIAIIMKPFSFEGQRRQDEVKILADELKDCVNFSIFIDIDTLLKMDLVTLDEALKTAYRAVFSAINAVSVLVSDKHKKHIHSLYGGVRQINVTEIIKVLESYKQGKVGFGLGHNVDSSIIQAVYDCPFLSIGLKDLDGIVICILSSSYAIGDNEVRGLLRTFRQATECTREVILSVVHDPDLKPSLIATTVITVCAERKSFQKANLLSRLLDSIPFVLNLLRRDHMQSDNPKSSNLRENLFPPMLANFVDKDEVPNMVSMEGTYENFGLLSGKEVPLDERCDEQDCEEGITSGIEGLDVNGNFSKYVQQNPEAQSSEREPLINRNIGQRYRISQDWTDEDAHSSSAVPVADNPKVFNLPVGVRLSDDFQETFERSNSRQPVERVAYEDTKVQTSLPSESTLYGFTDTGREVVNDLWDSASTLLRGRQLDVSKKQGVLSIRAASMLEAERDSKARWSPVVEIQYRGGIYKGRCQGGLPEGRGRLTFQDGSVYDGMWRYGKRSGIGSLFFINGDVFHGSWRDDLMHGKGWLYFHGGERWFANFWKGRANGEGRFYSKSGEVFFGEFQDGWRHGRFLCIKVDGARYVEIWNEGILLSSEELDS